MASRISFTKAEREAVQAVLEKFATTDVVDVKGAKALRSLLQKMDEATTKKVDAGLGWKRFVDILKEELGNRLALPPNPGPAWYSKISSRLRETGLDEEGTRKLAQTAKRIYSNRPISADFLSMRISELLAQSKPVVKKRPTSEGADGQGYGLPEFEG